MTYRSQIFSIMNHIKKYDSFLFEGDAISGKEVAQYVTNISPEGAVPDYFIEQYILPNSYIRKEVDIRDLLESDSDFKEYIEHDESRYESDEEFMEDEDLHPDDLYLPIVVYKGMVLDGYNRSLINYRNGDYMVSAYVHE